MKIFPFAAALLLAIAGYCSAECDFLEVNAITDASVQKGSIASFPIAIKNTNPGLQSVYLSASNSHMPFLEVNFDKSTATLQPQGEDVFTFFVITSEASEGEYGFPVEITADTGSVTCSEYLNLELAVTASPVTDQDGGEIQVLVTPSALKQLMPGETQEYSIAITNGLDEEIIAGVDAASNPLGKAVRFSESDVRIGAREMKAVRAIVTMPVGAPGNDYEIVFRVRASSACCLEEFLHPVTVRSYAKTAQLSLVNEPLGCIAVSHGEKERIPLGVRNYGELTGPFRLELTGGESSLRYVTLPLKDFELSAGEREYFNITLFPQITAPIGLHRFILKASYLSYVLFEKEICYRVEGISNVEIEKPNSAIVRRCTTDGFDFKVKNTGTLEDDYAIDVKPLWKATPYAEPEEFSLSPGESQIVNYIVQTSCITPLGKQAGELTITPRIAPPVSSVIEFEVVPSNNTGESFLKISAPSPISAILDEEKKFIVNVQNTKSTEMANTIVTLEGIDRSWVRLESPLPKTIKPGKTAVFYVVIKPDAQGTFNLGIIASSGAEISKFTSELRVENRRIGSYVTHSINPVEEAGVTTEAFVTFTLKNTGNVPMNELSINVPAKGLNIVPLDYVDELAPGESKDIRLQVQPLDDFHGKEVPFQVLSSEGVVATELVTLPDMAAIAVEPEIPWRYILIGILLVVIIWLFSKQTL